MTEIPIQLAAGQRISFDVSEEGQGSPCFLLSVRKCGSSIANNMCRALTLAEINNRCYVDVGGTLFNNNIVLDMWRDDPAMREIIRPGVIYGGFRDAPVSLYDDPTFVAAPKLIVIRDPRDALVSEYFSNAYSHPLPKQSEESEGMTELMLTQRAKALDRGLDNYVLMRSASMLATFEPYAAVLAMPNTIVVKYEDMVFQKGNFMRRLAEHFSMRAPDRLIDSILVWADKLPTEEDPREFVRQVTPGDHKRKLSPKTIEALDERLASVMRLFGYLT